MKTAELGHAELTHIVFYTAKMLETRHFWEKVLGVKNRSTDKNRPNYKIGGFTVMFEPSEQALVDYSKVIHHFGFELSSQSEVKALHQKLRQRKADNMTELIGGSKKKGPYRFYIKDPNNISLEFETWEGTDPWEDRYFH